MKLPPATTVFPDDTGLFPEPEQEANRTTEATENIKTSTLGSFIVSIPFN